MVDYFSKYASNSMGSYICAFFQRRHPITGRGTWRRRTASPHTYKGAWCSTPRHHTLNIKGDANFCATIPRVQKGATISAPLYFVYNRRRRFPHHYTSWTKGGADFCSTLYHVQNGAPISAPVYLVYIRERRFLRQSTSYTEEGADFRACIPQKTKGGALFGPTLPRVQ